MSTHKNAFLNPLFDNSDSNDYSYNVDIVLLIDASQSMAPFIEKVKKNALKVCHSFYEYTQKCRGIRLDKVRAKVITFRDYKYDGENAIIDSGFCAYPHQIGRLRKFITDIKASGGGGPKSALEALALAMQSDWNTCKRKQRHVIYLFTDAPAVPLGDPERIKKPYYPTKMPADLNELGEMWEGISEKLGGMPPYYCYSKRLILFAPDVEPWNSMQIWNNVWFVFCGSGHGLEGLEAVDLEMALNLIWMD